MTTQLTTQQFIERSKQVHNNRYDYSQTVYIGTHSKVSIMCREHGVFEQRAKDHLKGSGCQLCGNVAKATTQAAIAKSEFPTRAAIVHNNKYDYSLVEYKSALTKVKIICSIHGVFEQKPSDHLKGHGCAKCGNESIGWTRTKFKDKCIKNNNGSGILYVLECFNDSESLIKIGITSHSIKERYHSKASMPYEYTVLHEIVGSPEFIYDLETLLHKKSKNYKYSPSIPFGGSSTECFEANPTYLDKLNIYLDFKRKGTS